MTDEIKTCDCKEKVIAKLKEFAFITAAVFLGALLAILLSASILRPKYSPCHRGMMGPYPRMERHLPPPPMMDRGVRGQDYRGSHRALHPQYKKHHAGKDFAKVKADKQYRPDRKAPINAPAETSKSVK